MTNRFVLTLWMLIFAIGAPATAQDRTPNIVLILADDLGYADVGFNGRKEWATPNLDRLAKQGTTFHRFYTAGVVCAPARAALLTGRYGIHNGVTGNGSLDLPAEEVTIAEVLKTRGYATALFGKWHHGRPRPGNKTYTHPMDQGFDEFFGFTNASHAHQKFPKELFDGREKKPSTGYADALFTDRAVDFIGRNSAKPFFLYLPYTAPHGAIEAPDEDLAQHKGKFEENDAARPVNAHYAAMMTRMDKEVGRVVKALDDAGITDDTMIVFTSDHGATFEVLQRGAALFHDSNRPFRGQKRTLWEGGMRVPTFIRWPGGNVPPGRESRDVLHMTDLMPTFLAATSTEVPADLKLDGRNVLDVFRGTSPAPQRTLFWEWREGGNTQLAAMRGNMKLIITGENNPELYDVEADPAERQSRLASHGEMARQLRSELDAWMETESEAAKDRGKKNVSAE